MTDTSPVSLLSPAAQEARLRIREAGDLAYAFAGGIDNDAAAEKSLRITQANAFLRHAVDIQQELAKTLPYEFGELYIPSRGEQ